jgi:hypothetical protein
MQEGCTALFDAAVKGSTEMVELLMHRGASVNATAKVCIWFEAGCHPRS